jgi:hypothetical protein
MHSSRAEKQSAGILDTVNRGCKELVCCYVIDENKFVAFSWAGRLPLPADSLPNLCPARWLMPRSPNPSFAAIAEALRRLTAMPIFAAISA